MKKRNLETRENILRQAYRLFLTENFERVTIRDIERVTCRTRGAIFYHFRDKQHILEAVVNEIYFAEMRKNCNPLSPFTDFDTFLHKYKSPCERIILHIKETDKSINAEKAFFHFTLQAGMYYPNFDSAYSCIISEEETSLVRLLSNLINNISKNNVNIISSLLLNGFYSEAFTTALSSAKARVSLSDYFIANIAKLP
jgi:AcrR family transcriptional regulator